MEGNYKKWKNRINSKQDRLQDVTGNTGVGKPDSSATEKLDVDGNVKAAGFKTPTGTANQALTANGGVFDLNTKADLVGGKIPASQLPAYVDDVLEFANLASFPATGESGKIYIAIDTNLTYRWGGSSYVVMSSSLALGEISSTAYRGDRGKIAYDHSQATGNPHNTTKANIGLGNVDNTSDADKNVLSATKLTTARTIALTGDVTYTSGAFDGSGNVTGTATLANSGVTAGTYKSVTVDSKGRVTGGTNPNTIALYGITDAYTKTEIGDISTDYVAVFNAALI